MPIISGTLFHSYNLILFFSSISCPLSLVHYSILIISFSSVHQSHAPGTLFHSYNLILFCSSISCPLSLVHHSILIISFSSVRQSHAHYLWYTYSILIISFSSVHQSHALYLWYTYSILMISFSSVHQSHAHYLWYTIPFLLSHSPLFVNLMPIISGTLFHSYNLILFCSSVSCPLSLVHYSILIISFSSVHQSHAHYLWYTIPFL